MFVCNGTNASTTCNLSASGYKPNITTTVSFYQRRGDLVAIRSNFSIVSMSGLTTPQQITDLDVETYRASLRWLLNFTADAIPAPSAMVANFCGAEDQLKDPYHYGILLQSFQSIIVFPVWMFNANNFGNVELHKAAEIVEGVLPEGDLPPEFYTEAAIVAPYEKFKFDRAMFVLFLVLQSLALLFVIVVLLWVWFWVGVDRIPELSSFGLFDARFKTRIDGLEVGPDEILSAESSDVLRIVEGARVRMLKVE
jgi:hypothetical protein